MASRYWVGGSGNYSDDENHWAISSGGTPGIGNKPGDGDVAYVDNNSDTNADFTITLDEDTAQLAGISINNSEYNAVLDVNTYSLNADYTAGFINVYDGSIIVSTGSIYTLSLQVIANGHFGSNTAYTLQVATPAANGSVITDLAGSFNAPNASGLFDFYGGTFRVGSGFSHNNGLISFKRAGSVIIYAGSATLWDLYIDDGCTTTNILAGTPYNVTCHDLTIGTGTSGVYGTGACTNTINGTLTINSGGTFGTASVTYVLNLYGIAASNGTFIAPAPGGIFRFYGSTWYHPATYTHSNGYITFNGTTVLGTNSIFYGAQVASGCSLTTSGYDLTTLGANLSSSGTLNTAGSNITVNGTLTVPSTGVFGDASGNYNLYTFNDVNGLGTINAPNASYVFEHSGPWFSNVTTFNHNNGKIRFKRAGSTNLNTTTTQLYDIEIADGTTLACAISGSYKAQILGDVVVGDGSSGSITFAAYTGSNISTIYGDITINNGGTFGTAVGYRLNMYGRIQPSTGTFNASTSIIYIYADYWYTPTNFNNNNGSIVFYKSGEIILLNDSTSFAVVNLYQNTTLSNGGYDLSTAGIFYCYGIFNISGTPTISIGGDLIGSSTYTSARFGSSDVAYNLILTGIRGTTQAINTFHAPNAGGSFVYTGATWYTPPNFYHNNGEIQFTRTGTQAINLPSGSISTFYDLTIGTNSESTIVKAIRKTGTMSGSITDDQVTTDVLTVHDLTIDGILHATILGWTGIFSGFVDPSNIKGYDIADIKNVNGFNEV